MSCSGPVRAIVESGVCGVGVRQEKAVAIEGECYFSRQHFLSRTPTPWRNLRRIRAAVKQEQSSRLVYVGRAA
ncbi:protein of unknown function [Paraburkholderia kururiensis]